MSGVHIETQKTFGLTILLQRNMGTKVDIKDETKIGEGAYKIFNQLLILEEQDLEHKLKHIEEQHRKEGKRVKIRYR